MPEELDNEAGDPSDHPPHSELSQGQKIAVAVLVFFAIIVVFFWFSQYRQNLNQAFLPQGQNADEAPAENCPGGVCPPSEQELRAKDTDGDGLSDWEELYVYGTSPYLEDTDSDGIPDKQEILAGSDPNCPGDRDCHEEIFVDTPKDEDPQIPAAMPEFGEDLSPAQLRQMLITSGMDKEILDAVSDEDLMSAFREMSANPSQ
jgi:hypothetical protein